MTQQPPTPQEDKGTALANDWLEMQDTTTKAIVATLLSQERTRLKEEIEQSRIENASHGCLATNCEDPICGHTRCIDWMYGELLERLSKLTH